MPTATNCSRPYAAAAGTPGPPPATGNRGLNSGETLTIVYEQVIANTAPCATITNRATVKDRPTSNLTTSGTGITTNTTSTSVTDTVDSPLAINCYDLAITKVASPKPAVMPGGTITWTVTVTNNGPASMNGPVATDANPLVVSDVFPSVSVGLATLVSATGPAGACSLVVSTVTCATGLPSAGQQVFTFTQVVAGAAADGTTISNTATVTDGKPLDTNDSATDSTTVRPARLTLVKSLPSRGNAADQVTVTISNGATTVATATTAGTSTSVTTGVQLVGAGTYTLSEAMAAGSASVIAQYTNGISCANTNASSTTVLPSGAGTSFTVTPQALDVITCTFTNTPRPATVRIAKSTVGGFGGFDYTLTNLSTPTATVTTSAGTNPAASAAFTVSSLGASVGIVETVPAGWQLTSASCTDSNSALTGNPASFGTVTGSSLTIAAANVRAGAAITCTFTNAKLPTVVIRKQSVGGTGTFTFGSGTNGLPASLLLDTASANPSSSTAYTLTSLNTATSITETIPSNYNLTSATCVDASSSTVATTLSGGQLTIAAAAVVGGANITCTFTNTRKSAQVSVSKRWVNAKLGDQVTISSVGGTNNPSLTATANTVTETDAGTAVTVYAGETLTLSEAFSTGSASDYTTGLSCTGASDTNPADGLAIAAADDGATIVCTYTNTGLPRINAAKTAGTVTGPNASGEYVATYTVTVANSGVAPGAYGPLVDTPAFASNLQVVGASWTTSGTGAPAGGSSVGSGPFTVAPAGTSIAAGATHTFNVSVTFNFTTYTTATACGGSGTGLTNSVSLASGETTTADNTACVPPPAPPTPALTLAKAGLPVSFAAAGVSITYTYTITNSGNVTVDGPFTVVDDKTTVDCSGAALSLAPGGSTTCTSTYVTLQADVDAGFVTNIAAVTGTDPNGDPVTSPDATETVEAVQGAALTLAKAGLPVSFAAAGVSITYTYTITNAGNVTISGPFTVVDDKTLVDCSAAAALVLPGGSTTCTSTYVTLQADVDAGFVTNIAAVTGTDPNGDPVTSPTATETVEAVQSPALTLAKAGLPVSFAAAGVSITYTYTITNSGNVTVDGPLTVVDDKTTVDCSGAALSLLPTASTTCTSTYVTSQADVDNGGVTNVASGSGLDPNGDPVTSPTATETVEAVQSPALTLAKAGLPVSFAAAGVSITYTYTITNSGNVTVDGPFTVADDKTTVDCSGAALVLAPTASTTCTSTYVTSQADVDAGFVTNVASGSGLDPNGDPVTSPTATETVEAVQSPALMLTKVGDPVSFAAAGVSITYTYTITNSGNVTISGPFTVADDKTTVDCSGAALSLLPGGSTTCTSTYVTSQADVDNGGVTNVASGSGLDPNGDPVTSPTATETVEAVQSPALTLAKAGLPVSFAAAGVSITYTYTITNSGNVTVDGPFTVVDDKTSVDCSGAALVLAPGGSTSCTSTYVTSQADVDAGFVTNIAAVTGTDPNGDPVTSPTATETVEAVQGAALTLTKVGDPVSFSAAGVSITYTYTITNSGNVTVDGPFTVVDDKTTVDCSGAAALVLPGGSTTCTSTYVTLQADVDAGFVTNIAAVTGTDPNGDPVTSPTATETVEAVQSPALTLAKAGLPVSFAAAGVSITYTYTITNSGNVTIDGPFTVVDDKTTVDCSGAALVLAPGGSTTCTSTYVTSQADVDAGFVTNIAAVTGTDPNGDPVTSPTATETVEAVQSPALTLAKAGLPVSFAAAGVSITYTYTITNSGNVTISGPFTVADDKTTVDCSGAAALVLPGGSTTCTSTYVTSQADVDAGFVTNIAAVTGTDPNGDPVTSPTATETVEAVQSPALTLAKAGLPVSFAAAGVSITYTYTITNSGNVTIDGPFTVVDDKTTVDCSGAALVLAPGGSTTCTSTYVTLQADVDAGFVTNIAAVTGTDPNGDPVTSPDATETVEAVQGAALTLAKAGLPVSFAAAGVSITYTYTITNAGNVTISGPFTVVDDKTLVDCSGAAALVLPGGSTTCTSTYVTLQADVDTGFVTNVASRVGVGSEW